jgi:hypothetical protein
MSRPDAKKNITTLVKAYGNNMVRTDYLSLLCQGSVFSNLLSMILPYARLAYGQTCRVACMPLILAGGDIIADGDAGREHSGVLFFRCCGTLPTSCL